MIKIFADSTCDLTDDVIKKYDIRIIPLYIILSDKEYRDGTDISPDEIYSWAEKNHLSPKTASPSSTDVYDAFMPDLKNGDEIIAFSISSEMSTTYNIFQMIAEEMSDLGKIHVIDSRNLSSGEGLLVLNAAEMAAEGYSAEEIISKTYELIPKVQASFVVDTLDYLHRGGRCSGIEKLAGGILKLHPVISVHDGKMHPTRKYRGKIDSSIMQYLSDIHDSLLSADSRAVFITHSGCDKETISAVYEKINNLCQFDKIYISRAGGVISSH